jgi:hypothetical protein
MGVTRKAIPPSLRMRRRTLCDAARHFLVSPSHGSLFDTRSFTDLCLTLDRVLIIIKYVGFT